MSNPLPKAMLLDLDDTILDDSSTIEACWRAACDEHRNECSGVDPSAIYDAVRERSEWFWGEPERHRMGRLALDAARVEVVRLGLATLGIEKDGLAEKIGGTYSRQRHLTMEPLPEAIDTVRWLRARGTRLALITNGAAEAQRRKIERFGLAPLFDCILIEGEVGFGKPDARVYHRALHALAAEPGDAWMVGDHLDFDVAAPQQLGLFTVWIDTDGHGVPPGRHVRPDRIIRRLSELRVEG